MATNPMDDRWQRPQPERESPYRNGWSETRPQDAVRKVSEVVEESVRMAYEVIGENFRQGHEVAQRHSQGARGHSDAPQDIRRLTSRMIQLGRDMANTYFDAMEVILHDVNGRNTERDSRTDREDLNDQWDSDHQGEQK